jgi:hypothetical protein
MTPPLSAKRTRLWLTLTLVSGLPRVLSAFLLPNAFGDAYAYVRDIGTMSERIYAGTFSLASLYGFWLPLYQFICAVLSVALGHPYYVAKVVSALFGVGVCLLVYDLTFRLTADRAASLLAFALIALSPLHVFNSASAMTDVPHAFFVLASACSVLRGRWTYAAIFAALAGLTRMDSWLLLCLLPGMQLLLERRVSFVPLIILLCPPLFWLYVSWKATGYWLACFVERKQYMDWLLTVNPSLASFSLSGVARDAGALLLSTDLCVLAACILAAWIVYRRSLFFVAERQVKTERAVLSLNLFFFAYLGFIVLAYLTHKQPIIFPRYGLILFALGLPSLPWAFLNLTRRDTRSRRRAWLITVAATCLLSASIQFTYSAGFINREYARQAVADYLGAHFPYGTGTRVFNDDGTVLALSGIPPENFLSSNEAPGERAAFMAYLKERKVEYLVYIDRADSAPARLFPELKHGTGNDVFEPVMHARSTFLPADIWLYKVHVPKS